MAKLTRAFEVFNFQKIQSTC